LSAVSLVVGFLLPHLIRQLTKDLKADDEKVIVTYVVCFFAAMLIGYKDLYSGDIQGIIGWFTLVSTQAQLSFKLYYQKKWTN